MILYRWLFYLSIVGGLFGAGWWFGSESMDKRWQTKWDTRMAAETTAVITRNAAAVPLITNEALTLAKDTSLPITGAPKFFVCPPPQTIRSKVQPPAAPGPVDHGRAGLPGGDSGGAASMCDTTPAVAVGRDANAQIKELKAYIRDVCQNAGK